MIVKPKKISKRLGSNELRIINIDRQAVEELLWEHLMEHQAEYFSINPTDDNLICQMEWNAKDDMLTYAVLPIKFLFEGKKLDFDFLRKSVGATTASLYKPQIKKFHSLDTTNPHLFKE